MHANNTASSFKITGLLYLIVILLGLGFFYIYSAFENVQTDTKAVYKSGWLRGITEHISDKPSKKDISSIEHALSTIEIWSRKRNTLNDTNLMQNLYQVKQCWKDFSNSSKNEKQLCKKQTISLDNMITRIIYPEQQSLDNKLYFILILTLIAVLYLIYFIRLFIEHQINKHAIHDLETNLYNHNYFNEHMKTTCARAARYKYPLSLLSISISGIDKKSLDEKEYAKFMETVGDILLTMTRTSDVACRYDEDHIAIILPFTEDKNAEILKGRIQETFEKHNFNISQTPTFVFSIVQYEPQETAKEYIERAEKVLRER